MLDATLDEGAEELIELDVAIVDCEYWEVRRRMGGAVGGSGRGATYIRAVPLPCRRRNERTQWSRALHQQCTWAWHEILTDEEREYWTDFAAEVPWVDFLGSSRYLRAIIWFTIVSKRRLALGDDYLRDPAELWWGQTLETLSFGFVSATRISVSFTPALDVYNRLYVWGSGPLSPGASPNIRQCRLVGWSELSAESPVELELPWTVNEGRKLRIYACGLDYSGMTAEAYVADEVTR